MSRWSIRPQRFMRSAVTGKMAWLTCADCAAQRWLVAVKHGTATRTKPFTSKRDAYGFAVTAAKQLEKPTITQRLSQRYDTTAYRGAIYSSKAVPTGKTKT